MGSEGDKVNFKSTNSHFSPALLQALSSQPERGSGHAWNQPSNGRKRNGRIGCPCSRSRGGTGSIKSRGRGLEGVSEGRFSETWVERVSETKGEKEERVCDPGKKKSH